MKTNLKLDLNAKTLAAVLPQLRKAQPYVFGLALVAVFAYTAYFINTSINVESAATQTGIAPLPKITFDKPTTQRLKSLTDVNGDVPLDLGTDNPFK